MCPLRTNLLHGSPCARGAAALVAASPPGRGTEAPRPVGPARLELALAALLEQLRWLDRQGASLPAFPPWQLGQARR